MSKIRIAIVRGGPSDEHDVSLSSARSIIENLDMAKYEVVDVFVSKEGKWSIDGASSTDDDSAIEHLKQHGIDVVFLAVHGTYGEDGVLQKKLETSGLKFTGSDWMASQLAFDKSEADKVYRKNDLLVPKTQVIDSIDDKIILDVPLVVKPASQGSSVGVTIVKDNESLSNAVKRAFEYDHRALVQELIVGREVSCGVIEIADGLTALPPTEIIPRSAEFYDYDAKYVAGASEEITPPNMPEETIGRIQQLSKQAHVALGCKGYSRTDMFVNNNDEIYIIETNTLPGMTPTSILPQQAAAAGISFSDLLDQIIDNA